MRDPVAPDADGGVAECVVGHRHLAEVRAATAHHHRYQVDRDLVEQAELEALARDRPGRHRDDAVAREVDRIIFDELCRGHVSRVSQRTLRTQINAFAQGKAQAVVLGCTELVLAVDTRANIIPVYDTTCLHAEAAVEWMLEEAEPARVAA